MKLYQKIFFAAIFVVAFLSIPVVAIEYFNEEKIAANKNKTFLLLCTDKEDNKIFEGEMSYYEFDIDRNVLKISNGVRKYDRYTCDKFSFTRIK